MSMLKEEIVIGILCYSFFLMIAGSIGFGFCGYQINLKSMQLTEAHELLIKKDTDELNSVPKSIKEFDPDIKKSIIDEAVQISKEYIDQTCVKQKQRKRR